MIRMGEPMIGYSYIITDGGISPEPRAFANTCVNE